MRFIICASIIMSMISACESPSLIGVDGVDDESEIVGESGSARDAGGDSDDSCGAHPLQWSQCDPWDNLACPDGNCVLHGGPVIVWACDMEHPARPNGAHCLFNQDCDSGICIPFQYHPSPDNGAIAGACGIPCVTDDDCDEKAICQPSIEDIAGVQFSICLKL